VFPLQARRGGVLVRAGQTEGSVDLARLAGLAPAGVICEIIRDDGEMARLPDLESFATRHGLKILTVADLIAYRLQTERLVHLLGEREIVLDRTQSSWRVLVFEDVVESHRLLALVKGTPSGERPTLCRMHRCDLEQRSRPATPPGRRRGRWQVLRDRRIPRRVRAEVELF
jgi:3,4-dihydroxy 2-butanone 4-phosphate synthase/GTP cyclohydrolase II